MAWYHDGYTRVCGVPYDPSDTQNKMAHITNFHVQRDSPHYDPKSDSIEGVPVTEDSLLITEEL
jgi:hypothetical protein